MVQAAEWLIDLLGLLSGVLLGNRHRAGWVLSVATQVVWCAVAVATQQWAFVVASLAYAAVAARNWVRWRRTERLSFILGPGRDLTEDELAEWRARWDCYGPIGPGRLVTLPNPAVGDD